MIPLAAEKRTGRAYSPSQIAGTRVMMMAGGTGGHIYPALAVARALRSDGCDIEWLGTEKGLENTLVPENGFRLHYLNITGVRGKGFLGLIAAPWKIIQSIYASYSILKNFNPIVVIGLGGYASGPGGIAAWLLRKPLVIHEQNAVAGTTNKLLSHFATRILTGFPNVIPGAEFIGNPVREEFFCISSKKDNSPLLNVLVMGGSLGASALNEIVPVACQRLMMTGKPLSIFHQSGKNKYQETTECYTSLGVSADVSDYIDDMATKLAWADIVICRAGALTVAELSSAGVASVLVPFPHAIDDHQTKNAQWLADVGAAILLPQSALTAVSLADIVEELIVDREKLTAMAKAAKSVAKGDATERFKQCCIEVMCV